MLSPARLQLSAGIATARLRQRARHAEMERERRSLAAEVHDGLAQDLALALRELALLDRDAGSRARLREVAERRAPDRALAAGGR